MFPGSKVKKGFQDQLYKMVLMGQVKSSCKLISGLGTVEFIADLDKSSFVGSSENGRKEIEDSKSALWRSFAE